MVDARHNDTSYAMPVEDESTVQRTLASLAEKSAWQSVIASARQSMIAIGTGVRDTSSETWRNREQIAAEKYRALKGLFTRQNAITALPYVALFLLAFLPAAILGSGFQGVFNSPDETTRYLAAETFAETGNLYIEDDITWSDPSYATGPRGFAQHNGRSVPTYSPAPLVLFGLLSMIFGGAAPFMLAIVPGLLFVVLAVFIRRLLPTAPVYLPWIFLGVAPLWYWTSRVYMDLSLTFLFVAVALLVLTRAVQLKSEKHLFYGGAALGAAALSRIPEAPMLFIFGFAFMLAVAHQIQTDRNGTLRLGAIYAASIAASFIIPLMILNWWVNGSPATVSYTLLFEQHFPELVEPASNVLLEPFRLIWLALFPQPVDFSVVYSTFTYQVLFQNPYLFFIGAVGLTQSGGLIARKFGGYGTVVLAIAFIYMVLSRNAPGTFLAGIDEPDLRASLVRYWMPLYLLLGIGAVLALHRLPHRISLLLVIAFVVSSAYHIWYTGPESVSALERNYGTNSERYAQFYDEHTEADALIVAGSAFDKFTVPYRRTIGIWPDTATETNLQHLADTGAEAHRRGTPVYYMFGSNEPSDAIEIVSSQLESQFLGVEKVADPSFAGELWKIISMPQTLELSAQEQVDDKPDFTPFPGFGAPSEPPGSTTAQATEFESSFTAPANSFSLLVLNDGSARNLIANPSFETGAEPWGGPNVQGPVEVSDEMARFGDSSLRMELSPAPKAGERVRRTYSLELDDSWSGDWVLRGQVNVQELSDAAVEVIVFIDRKDGTRIDRVSSKIEAAGDGWQEIVIAGPDHPDTAKLSVQISIVASAAGGAGVAFWDGIEVIDGSALASQYCDGDNFGCTWEGESHASASSRSGGIDSLKIEAGSAEFDIESSLRSGDELLFEDGFVSVRRADGSSEVLGSYGEIAHGETVSLSFVAESQPVATVVGP